MNEKDIKQKIRELDSKLPMTVQQNAVDCLMKTEDKYLNLLFDTKLKCTWENSVKIIDKIGFPRNEVLLPKLIWLLQDINWPGALMAAEILKSIEKRTLVPLVEKALIQAYEYEDYMWIGGLKMVVDKKPILKEDFINPATYELLKYSDF